MKKIKILIFVLVWMLCRPIDAEAAKLPEYGSITIYNRNIDEEPVSGVEYTIWQVDESNSYHPETAAEAKEHLLKSTGQSKKTNTEGKAVFTALPAGLYYVAESDLGSMNSSAFPNMPFLAEIPMTNEAGTGWISDVEVYLKNQVLNIDQFVNGAGGEDYNSRDINQAKHRPVAGDEKFGYSIVSYFPGDIGLTAGESYIVTDKMNKSVTCEAETLMVYAVEDKETAVKNGYLLTEGQHYEKAFNQADNTLTVRLTDEGMSLLRQRNETEGDRFLLLKFDSRLNEDAVNGVNLYSEASLTYQRGVVHSGTFNSDSSGQGNADSVLNIKVADEPEIHTGQIKIVKVDAQKNEQYLAGAKFGIARSEEEAAVGEYIRTGVTDKEGSLVFRGLRYGELGYNCEQGDTDAIYWLVEIEAPTGYSRVKEPVEVKFQYQNDNGEMYFAKLTVYNQPIGAITPGNQAKAGSPPGARRVKTGDSSAVLLMTALLLMSMAVILIIWKKKRISKQSM